LVARGQVGDRTVPAPRRVVMELSIALAQGSPEAAELYAVGLLLCQQAAIFDAVLLIVIGPGGAGVIAMAVDGQPGQGLCQYRRMLLVEGQPAHRRGHRRRDAIQECEYC